MDTGNTEQAGWIGVDLDGTLAFYNGWHGPEHIGSIIQPMAMRIEQWLQNGREVRIFTARVCHNPKTNEAIIQDWLQANHLPRLQVTCVKDYDMEVLYADRARQVEFNTGLVR